MAEGFLHGRLVPTQECRPHRCACDPATLADLGRGLDMSFDGGFDTLDLDGDLDPANRLFQSIDIDDRSNLFVVGQPSRNLLVEPILGALPDSDDLAPTAFSARANSR